MGPISTWADTLRGGGPAGGRIEIDADELRLRMADFKVDVPRASVRRAARSSHQTRGTIGVHAKGGSWLANGSANGLVEIEIDPPCHTERCLAPCSAGWRSTPTGRTQHQRRSLSFSAGTAESSVT